MYGPQYALALRAYPDVVQASPLTAGAAEIIACRTACTSSSYCRSGLPPVLYPSTASTEELPPHGRRNFGKVKPGTYRPGRVLGWLRGVMGLPYMVLGERSRVAYVRGGFAHSQPQPPTVWSPVLTHETIVGMRTFHISALQVPL